MRITLTIPCSFACRLSGIRRASTISARLYARMPSTRARYGMPSPGGSSCSAALCTDSSVLTFGLGTELLKRFRLLHVLHRVGCVACAAEACCAELEQRRRSDQGERDDQRNLTELSEVTGRAEVAGRAAVADRAHSRAPRSLADTLSEEGDRCVAGRTGSSFLPSDRSLFRSTRGCLFARPAGARRSGR